MDAEALIGSLISGTLSGRRKRSRGALRYLTGGRGSLLNARALLTVGGLVWGLLESSGTTSATAGSGTQWGNPLRTQRLPVPPAGVTPPPLPATGQVTVPPEVLRIVRLVLSAARADGNLSEPERAVVLAHAREAGAEALVSDELRMTHPLDGIVRGVDDETTRKALYSLAFTIVRADEGVSGAERIYLAQLADCLNLEPEACRVLEEEVVSGIASATSDHAPG